MAAVGSRQSAVGGFVAAPSPYREVFEAEQAVAEIGIQGGRVVVLLSERRLWPMHGGCDLSADEAEKFARALVAAARSARADAEADRAVRLAAQNDPGEDDPEAADHAAALTWMTMEGYAPTPAEAAFMAAHGHVVGRPAVGNRQSGDEVDHG